MAKSRITPEQKARRAQLGQLMEGAGIKSMEDIQELFKDMIASFVNQGLEGELDKELGYSKCGLGLIMTKLEDTIGHSIAMLIVVLNCVNSESFYCVSCASFECGPVSLKFRICSGDIK